jgi:hypothetical protein
LGVALSLINQSDFARARSALVGPQYYYYGFNQFDDNGSVFVPSCPWALIDKSTQWTLETYGITSSNTNKEIADTINGDDLGSPYGAARFAAVVDPENSSRRAARLIIHKGDPFVGSNRTRTEVGFSPQDTLSYGSRYIFAYKFKKGETWVGANDHAYTFDPLHQTGTGDYITMMQIHAGVSGARPMLDFTVFDDTLFIVVRYGGTLNLDSVNLAVAQVQLTQRWQTFTGEIVPDYTGGMGGKLKVWLDGSLIVDYTGRIGYDTVTYAAGELGYFKCGLYKSMDHAEMVWDRVLTRSLYVKGLLVLKHATLQPWEVLTPILDRI